MRHFLFLFFFSSPDRQSHTRMCDVIPSWPADMKSMPIFDLSDPEVKLKFSTNLCATPEPGMTPPDWSKRRKV